MTPRQGPQRAHEDRFAMLSTQTRRVCAANQTTPDPLCEAQLHDQPDSGRFPVGQVTHSIIIQTNKVAGSLDDVAVRKGPRSPSSFTQNFSNISVRLMKSCRKFPSCGVSNVTASKVSSDLAFHFTDCSPCSTLESAGRSTVRLLTPWGEVKAHSRQRCNSNESFSAIMIFDPWCAAFSPRRCCLAGNAKPRRISLRQRLGSILSLTARILPCAWFWSSWCVPTNVRFRLLSTSVELVSTTWLNLISLIRER